MRLHVGAAGGGPAALLKSASGSRRAQRAQTTDLRSDAAQRARDHPLSSNPGVWKKEAISPPRGN